MGHTMATLKWPQEGEQKGTETLGASAIGTALRSRWPWQCLSIPAQELQQLVFEGISGGDLHQELMWWATVMLVQLCLSPWVQISPPYRDPEHPQMPMSLPNLTIEYKSKNTGLRHPGLYGTWKIKPSRLYLGELRRNNPRFVPRDGACGNMAVGTIPVVWATKPHCLWPTLTP